MRFAIDIKETGYESLTQVGGKARNLGQLANAGFNIPEGFCLTVRAFKEVLTYNKININTVTADAILYAELPPEIESEIREICQQLKGRNAKFIAVRASGVSEDGNACSYAGLYKSFLNLQDESEVVNAVRRCWASGAESRVQVYSSTVTPYCAVIVQEMVFSEKSGVAFSQNPVSSGTSGMMIEGSWGMGEAIVSGLVTPDCYVIDKVTGKPLSKRVMTKEWELSPGQERPHPVPEEKRNLQLLSDDELYALWEQLVNVVNLYEGVPQDIEWTFSHGSFYILQSRPITTLDSSTDRPKGVWSRGITEDLWSEALSPLTSSIIVDKLGSAYTFQTPAKKLGIEELVRNDILAVIDNYLYINAEVISEILKKLPASLIPADVKKILPPNLHEETFESPSNYRWMCKIICRTPLLLISEPYCRIIGNYRKVNKKFLPQFQRRFKALEREIQQADEKDKLILAVEDITDLTCKLEEKVSQWSYGFAMGSVFLLRQLLAKVNSSTSTFAEFMSVSKPNKTLEMNNSFNELYTYIQENHDLKEIFSKYDSDKILFQIRNTERWQSFNNKLMRFLKNYGARSTNRDFVYARWDEKPDQVIKILKHNLNCNTNTSASFAKSSTDRHRTENERLKEKNINIIFRFMLRIMFNYAQKYLALREDLRFHLDMVFSLYRRVFLQLGSIMTDQGIIRTPQQIFYLTYPEVEQFIREGPVQEREIQEKIEQRLKQFENNRQRQPFDYWVHGTGFDRQMDDDKTQENVLKGIGTSSGCYRGKARVIKGPEEFDQLADGEILVAVSTDPGWTPLFRRAGAVVTEIGGVLNHSSIVAREYCIPAVVGVNRATSHVATGDVISVNGDEGIIQLIGPE